MNSTRRRFRSGSAGFSIVSRRPERGVLLVVAVVSMVALLGMAALTIDIGRMATAAQRAQEVADATALAGAQRLPSTSAASTQLTQVLAANNASVSWPTIEIDTNSDITYYTTGDTIPDYGILQSNEHAIKVQTHVRDTFAFAGIFGDEQMHVVREATAKAEIGSAGGLPCMFAGCDDAKEKGIWTTGSGKDFYGLVHSNTKVDFGASSTVFHGLVECRNGFEKTAGVTADHVDTEGSIEAYPVNFEKTYPTLNHWLTKYPPTKTVASIKTGDLANGATYPHSGNIYVGSGGFTMIGDNKTFRDSMIFVDGDVHFGGRDNKLINCTIIATGQITMVGSGWQMSPKLPELAMMSYYDRFTGTASAIDIAGSSLTLAEKIANGALADVDTGTIYAPNSRITYNGSGHRAGSLIAKAIKITGSDLEIHGTETGGGSSKTRVFLIK